MIDLTPLMDLGIEILTAVVLALGGWVLAWLGRKLKLGADNEVRAYLERALASGVNYAANLARERGQDLSLLEVRNATVRDAVSYVVAHTPGALARFGVTPDALAELVRARLPKP